MDKKKTIFALLGLLLVGVVAAGTASAFGFGVGSTEDREQIRTAIENNDFESWKGAMQGMINEENFNSMVERHQNRMQHRENMDAVRDAIDSGSYDDYLDAIADLENEPRFAVDSEEEFDLLVEMHEARQNQDFDTAKEIADELGFEFGPRQGKGMRGKFGGMRAPENLN